MECDEFCEDEGMPEHIPLKISTYIFNIDTVDKMISEKMKIYFLSV